MKDVDASPTPSLRAPGYAWSLTAVAMLAALSTALALILLSNGAAVSLRPAPLGDNPAWAAPWLAALFVVALMAAGLAAATAAFAIRVIRIMTYQRTMRVYCRQELARAGITRTRDLLALSIVNQPPSSENANPQESLADRAPCASAQAHAGATYARNAVKRLSGMRRALLLGAPGAGKTTLLLVIASRSTTLLASVGVALGLRRLPALISLPGLATVLGRGENAESYLASQFARLGSDGLAARTARMLRRGALILLCDDYDALDDSGRKQVDQTLSRWSNRPFERCRLIVACDSARLNNDESKRISLNALPVSHLQPLSARALARLLWRAKTTAGGANLAEHEGDPLSMASATLRDALPLPAIARVYAAVRARDQSTTLTGYSATLRQALLIKRDTATGAPDSENALDIALVWGALAASLQAAASAALPLDASRTPGECAAAWLTERPPLMPVSFALQDDIVFGAADLDQAIEAGIEAGVLRRQVDGLALAFSHDIARYAAITYWLDAMDNGLGRLNSTLLTPAWVAPVVLWASAHSESSDVPQRIYRLTQSPDSVASRAGLARGSDVAPVALALALVATIEATEPALIAPGRGDPASYRRRFVAQQQLRDLLDSTAIMAADTARRPALARALRLAQERGGVATAASVRTLINLDSPDGLKGLDRLVRAQLTLTLGLLATPEALEELIQQVNQTDHTLRQAARLALVYAGPDAISVAQRLAASAASETRARASEALAYLTAALPEAPEAIGNKALSGLRSADALQRRAAVTTLGALRASSALDALVARLDDTSLDVQIAAVAALGRLGAPEGLAALRKRATSPSPALRRAIADALGAVAEPQSLLILLDLLKDRDPAVRAAAAIALGAQGDRRAAGALRDAIGDANPQVSRAAHAAARRLTGV